jgi:periplasmic divalent cation tolerance protein
MPDSATNCFIVLVTAPDLEVARSLAKKTLNSRLVACANIIPGIESHYWWQDKLETSTEVQLVFKTTQQALRKLCSLIEEQHPYEVPEVISIPISSGSKGYLHWLQTEIQEPSE